MFDVNRPVIQNRFVTLRLPADMLRRAERAARASGQSRSAFIRRAVDHAAPLDAA
jgi:predicted transcriptional regulator